MKKGLVLRICLLLIFDIRLLLNYTEDFGDFSHKFFILFSNLTFLYRQKKKSLLD